MASRGQGVDPSPSGGGVERHSDPAASSGPSPSVDETLKSVRAALESTPAAYRTLVDTAGDAILIADFETAFFIDANNAASEMFGYATEEFWRLTGRRLSPADTGPLVDEVSAELVRTGRAWRPQVRMMRKGGSEFWGELRLSTFVHATRRFYVVIIRDVSERVQREAELARAYDELRSREAQLVLSAKLAAVGQLAAGVAHEINNPSAWVQANLRTLQGRLDPERQTEPAAVDPSAPEPIADLVSDSLLGMERIVSIVRDLRTFARVDDDGVELVSLDDVVSVACNIVKNQISHRARLVQRLGNPSPLTAHPGRLTQVVTNLLVNAAQAIEEGMPDANEVTVETLGEESQVRIAVSDTGSGMSPELRARIFEPFFSTKPRDTGTGLGLSLCAEIVRQHGGEIRVESTVGRGSRFEVVLPRDNGLTIASREPHPGAPAPGRRLRILIIDDEVPLLRAYQRTLRSTHEVTLVRDGAAGLECIEGQGPFDVILCDLMMPGLDGIAVHEILRERAPELLDRLVISSGGAFTERARRFLVTAGLRVLEKPISPDLLEETIRSVGSGVRPPNRSTARSPG